MGLKTDLYRKLFECFGGLLVNDVNHKIEFAIKKQKLNSFLPLKCFVRGIDSNFSKCLRRGGGSFFENPLAN